MFCLEPRPSYANDFSEFIDLDGVLRMKSSKTMMGLHIWQSVCLYFFSSKKVENLNANTDTVCPCFEAPASLFPLPRSNRSTRSRPKHGHSRSKCARLFFFLHIRRILHDILGTWSLQSVEQAVLQTSKGNGRFEIVRASDPNAFFLSS